ncbi:hypothetical protein HELRODRAFT_168974 [Helobdella robusta]|uniref:Uncharacterized protein n=1 Tax=Helobdella robusta TaxID=6412 RepID=T1F175_HELRO|nr:hypothetical protein HELRODRAFT_168974 [Helobdella robusta]ESO09039.1 hypothetical protein HELRODRAFT_168974 [Helobdella robusta]
MYLCIVRSISDPISTLQQREVVVLVAMVVAATTSTPTFSSTALTNSCNIIQQLQKYYGSDPISTLQQREVARNGAARLQKALEINMKIMKDQHQVELTSLQSAHEQQLVELEMRLKHEAETDKRATTEQHKLELENIQTQAENLVRDTHNVCILNILHMLGEDFFALESDDDLSEMKSQHDSEITTVTHEYESKLEVLKSEFTHQLEALKKSYESRINNVTKHYEDIKEHLNEKNVQLHNDYQDMMRRNAREGSGMSTPTSQGSPGTMLSHKYLEQEVDSLRAVMELRNSEINQLRMHNNLMEKQLEEIPKAQLTINSLQQKIENLEAIINLKADYEKDLAEKHNVLLRKLDQESRAKKRLSMNNEELAFRLSQTLNNVDISVDPSTTTTNVLITTTTSTSSPPPKYTNGVRPKSMIATITTTQHSTTTATVQQLPPTSPSNKSTNRLSGPPPTSAKPSGIKLRRPKDDSKQGSDGEERRPQMKPSDV